MINLVKIKKAVVLFNIWLYFIGTLCGYIILYRR